MKRHPLTLIEVTLALGLAAIVIAFLFSSLLQTVKISRSLAAVKEEALETSFCYSRLLHIFSNADPTSFQFDETSVTFTFENGLDPALLFSGEQTATLHFDKTLSLDISLKGGAQTEVLLTDLEMILWEPHPHFLTLHLKRTHSEPRQFVFFFSDHPA